MRTRRTCLLAAFIAAWIIHSPAQVQEAWVVRYNGGFAAGSNAPVAMALDSAGNLCVAGSSQNDSGLYDYVLLRYAPDGSPLPVAKYHSMNGASLKLNDLALDRMGDAYVTGSGGTAEFGTNGSLLWTAPYAGKAIAVDTNGNTYLTGFSTNYYATAKLDPAGSNLWVRTYASQYTTGLWPIESQKIAVDGVGCVYIAGWESWGPGFLDNGHLYRYAQPSMLKYDPAGTCLWTNAYAPGPFGWGQTKGLLVGDQGGLFVAAAGDSMEYLLANIGGGGQTAWVDQPSSLALSSEAVTRDGIVYATGSAWCTIKFAATNGQVIWTPSQRLPGQANIVAADPSGRVYAAGVQPTMTNGTDSALVRYDPANGSQLWTKRYDGPAHGDDGAAAMAIAPDGSIYVTGYSANTSGGTDIFVIKYVPASSIQRQSNSMLLQFSGLPGQTCGLEASTDLVSWATLGLVTADTNGVFQFADTNANLFPSRLYRWHYP